MVNLYDELNLNRDGSIDELNKELNGLESTWKRREITNPEKATKILALIIDARKAFATEEAKRTYDTSLDEANKPQLDGDEARREEVKKWFVDALQYKTSNQNDLAKEAIQRAISLLRDSDPNFGEIHDRAVGIFVKSMDYDTALSCANRAIMSDPNNLNYYDTKAFVFMSKKFEMMKAERAGRQIDYNVYDATAKQEREAYLILLKKAQEANDQQWMEKAYDQLASSYYWDAPQDRNLAVEYANKAVASMKERLEEVWEIAYEKSQAKFVFDDIGKNGSSQSSTASSPKGGCYVATAVYGSYDCPEVWTLRRFRDDVLKSSWYGRLFIKCYYAISPTIVRWFGNSRSFNVFWRGRLDKMVRNLQEQGISSDKYYD